MIDFINVKDYRIFDSDQTKPWELTKQSRLRHVLVGGLALIAIVLAVALSARS